jgi:hypothetical protein
MAKARFAAAYGRAAFCYVHAKAHGWISVTGNEIAEVTRLAQRAVELGKDDAMALAASGWAFAFVVLDLGGGAALIDRALGLNSNLAEARFCGGWVKNYLGEPKLAIERFARAMRLSPLDPWVTRMRPTLSRDMKKDCGEPGYPNDHRSEVLAGGDKVIEQKRRLPLLALFGPDGSNWRCPFRRAKRTSQLRTQTSEFDPERTFSRPRWPNIARVAALDGYGLYSGDISTAAATRATGIVPNTNTTTRNSVSLPTG